MFHDIWRPLLLTLAVAMVVSLFEQRGGNGPGIYHVMSGASYFRGHGRALAWLVLCAAGSAALYYAATASLAKRDF